MQFSAPGQALASWGGAFALGLLFLAKVEGAVALSYRDLIERSSASTLSVSVQSLAATTGTVSINGSDSQRPTTPFRFDWGDGQSSQGFFPASHTYADRSRNYVATVTATYASGATDAMEVTVRFTPPLLQSFKVPANVAVTVPATLPTIVSTHYGIAVPALQAHPATAFAVLGREIFERVLGAFALIQQDLVNDDLRFSADGTFRQIIAAAPETTSSYAFSVWYSDPPLVAARAGVLGADTNWSTVAHELGHNMSLNSPAAYRLGGKIDGNANAIISETLAQIFEHVTCHLLVNHAAEYGLPDDLAADIARRARESFGLLRRSTAGAYAFWNDPATAIDETMPAFMTLAYQFFASGDFDGVRYRAATKRLMYFLQRFNSQWETRFSPRANSAAAEAFRATLMVAALSFSQGRDLRETFRALRFPVDDAVFGELTATVGPYPRDSSRLGNLSVRTMAGTGDKQLTVGFAIGGSGTKQLLVRGIGPALAAFGLGGALADPQLRLSGSQAETLAENNDWGGGALLRETFGAVGAFPLPAGSRDAALAPTLRTGSYTAQITSTAAAGTALVEVYDLEDLGGTARLTNLSARTEVGTGDDILVAAFVIQGTAAKRVLIRAVGPTLAQFGVNGVLADPQLTLFRGTEAMDSNDDWAGDATLAAAFAQVGAFALPAGSRDSALVATLTPGVYSAQVAGAGNHTGVALVEVYELP